MQGHDEFKPSLLRMTELRDRIAANKPIDNPIKNLVSRVLGNRDTGVDYQKKQ